MGGQLFISGKGYDFTDNFSIVYPFLYNHKVWLAVEQGFQAQKFDRDSEPYIKILKSHDYAEWMQLGRWNTMKYNLDEWDTIKSDVMEKIIREKVKHNNLITQLKHIQGNFESSGSEWSKINANIWNKIKDEIQ